MFSVSDIKEEVYPATYRRGKDLYETGGVRDFSYEIYLENDLPMAEVSAKVRGQQQEFYQVTATIDEEFADVSNCSCNCEAFYNYDGLCKHCVAAILMYINRRQAQDILRAKRGALGAETDERTLENKPSREIPNLKTSSAFKNILNQYSMRAGVSYLIPESVYGKVELEPYFKMDYSYAMVEFKIGTEQKYVLKNISAFLRALERNEKVKYGKKLDFYHNKEAFTENAWKMITFLKQQELDKHRQTQYHAYYAYTGSYERTMELDEVGIDRFFEAVGQEPFCGEMGYCDEMTYHVASEEYRPKLTIRAGAEGIFLQLEDLHIIRGSGYYYFYEGDLIYRSPAGLKEKTGEIFDYLERQAGGECYVAAEELPMFCRDLLPLLRENFTVISEGFDESLYVPKKPEFELYLDKQDNQVIGAKLMAVYGEEKYNVLEKPGAGEVRELADEMRIRSLVEPISMNTEWGIPCSFSLTMRNFCISC